MVKKPVNPVVAATLAALRKQVGRERAHLLSDGALSDVTDVMPTGIDVFDQHLVGVGGLAAGRIVEVFGAESTGKTTFVLATIAAAQRAGGIGMLSESERALDSSRAAQLGCNLDDVILNHPDCLEDACDWIEKALRALPDFKPGKGHPPHVIALDSIAATPTRREVTEGIQGGEKMGEKARIMSQSMRIIPRLVAEKHAVLVLTNQTRKAIGAFGIDVTTPGGEAVKFHSSVRLWLLGGKAVKRGTTHVGKVVTCIAVKNKLVPPWRKARVLLNFDTGWDTVWSTLDHAKTAKLVDPKARPTVANYLLATKALGWKPSMLVDASAEDPDLEETDDEPEEPVKPLVEGEDDDA